MESSSVNNNKKKNFKFKKIKNLKIIVTQKYEELNMNALACKSRKNEFQFI